MTAARALLRAMFDAAVASASADRCVPPNLPPAPKGRTVVVGAGKAAAAMARAVETHWAEPLEGVVVTRYGHAVPCARIRVLEAGHPVPDAAGVAAAQALLAAVAGLGADDLVLCLISGGGSALLPAMPPGVSLEDERALTRALLRSGATIAEINAVRRQVSLIKGGRLAAAAAPARVETLIISDVPGDDPALVASGPTIADAAGSETARAVIARHGITPSVSIETWLRGDKGALAVSLGGVRVVATAQMALEAAASVARAAGYAPLILGDAIEGEAAVVGTVHAGIVRQVLAHGQPAAAPCVLLSGGETSVTVRGGGRGGRNVEFLLGLLDALGDCPGVTALAADTDGIDGTEDNAGALIDETSFARASALGLSPRDHLARNDGYSLFDRLGDLLMTGPTLTNVNDFRAILIDPPGQGDGA
ncbi:hydroxypyruvate reductase [Sphingomonas zeicaulis]|uniref:glycerate kinase type-2 family protein n=1 Tax=Sphingomonas zeicaulis TaxID=1632740 RepID=UPI003D260CBB